MQGEGMGMAIFTGFFYYRQKAAFFILVSHAKLNSPPLLPDPGPNAPPWPAFSGLPVYG